MPASTVRPRPATEIIDATTAMLSESMTVWFSPARMVGRASGSSSLNSNCIGVLPKARPASTRSSRTVRRPRLVRRINGEMA